MKQGDLVSVTLHSLKERMTKNKGLIEVYNGDGDYGEVECTFYDPVTIEQINELEAKTGWILPEDYKRFLLITNGCKLFDHPDYGGENDLYRLEELIEFNYEDPFEGCFSIAYIYSENIVINSERYRNGDPNYLFVKDKIDQFHEAEPLNMNFEMWLDRFVICQGNKFWNWKYWDAKRYYKE